MIRILLALMLLMISNAFAFDSSGAFNVLTMSYTANTSVYQRIVLSDTQKAETAINFSVDVKNGGGRPTQNLQGVPQAYASQTDSAFITIKVYDAVGTLIGSQVSQTYTLHNYGSDPSNHFSTKPGDNLIPWSTANVTYTGSLTNARFIEVWMTGTDGAWWAGNYGPEWRTPTVTIGSAGPNVAYNPEFGIAPNSQKAQGWFNTSNSWAFCGVTSGSAPCVTNESTVTANMWGGGYSANGGSLAGAVGGYTSILTTSTADAAATTGTPTATVTPPAPTVTGTTISYTTRGVVSGNTTTVYRTPVTTTSYSDGTSTSSNGTEAVYQTKVASNVVTNKIVNGVLTTTTTPINTVNTGGVTTIESNGNSTITTQNVLQGLNYKVYDFDAYTYNCGWLGCIKNLLGPYTVPNLSPGAYNQVASGRTGNGIYVPTNGSFPAMGDGTLVAYTGTITAPITSLHPAGSVYRLYFYSNSDDGFVLDINGQNVINDRSTFQLQNILGGYTASGWIDIVAGQTYNLQAWYWNDLNGYGLRFQWDYGAGRMSVPNSAFSTGWITETNTVDTSGVVYSNSSVIDMSGTTVSMYPNYVIIGSGTPGDMSFGSHSDFTTGQQTKIDTWTNKTITDGNKIYVDQLGGGSNTYTIDQDGNKNLLNITLNGTNNNVTAKQGVQGIGQNEMKLNFEGNNNVVNVNQARDTQGNPVGGNGHYLDATIAGWGVNLTVQQTNNGGVGGHYNETTIYGNGNNVTAKQTDNGNKIMFLKVDGAINTVEAVQKGTGQHRLDATLTGNHNNASILQEGSVANNATLNLTNAGGPASVIIQQNGGQSVGVTTTCSTAGGCAPVTVRQGY